MSSGDPTTSSAPNDSSTESPVVETPSAEVQSPEIPITDASSGDSTANEAASTENAFPEADVAAPQKPGTPKSKHPLPRIGRGPLSARGQGVAKPVSPAAVSTENLEASPAGQKPGGKKSGKGKQAPRPRLAGEKPTEKGEAIVVPKPGKIAVPNLREGLSEDLEAELAATLEGTDVDSFLGGTAGLPDRREQLAEGARVQAQVIKIHDDVVFVALGGPDEGTVPFEQFEAAEPTPGTPVEVLVRGFSREDGLYSCSLPGQALEVSDWDDIEEGSVVEATVTGHNTGGLECKIGAVRGFMPISQVTEYRVEDLSEFVDQKMICLVTEANERRGNLVVSRRAVLEREREAKRKEQLEKIEQGDILEGVVRSVRDFGAFVDLGGLDGLIHVSKLSWERVKHPSEVIEEGQKVKVKVDKIDKQSGKIGLSYRDLLENPWDTAESQFAVNSVHKGTVTRVADFGCFVRLTAGVEGLVHISELAHHRVSKVSAFVNEGDEVEVKVMNFDREAQKIGLSIKAAQSKAVETTSKPEEEEEPQREVAVKPSHTGPLRGGNDRDAGGERFGLRW